METLKNVKKESLDILKYFILNLETQDNVIIETIEKLTVLIMKCDNLDSQKKRKKLIVNIQENIILIETGKFFNTDEDEIKFNLVKYNYLIPYYIGEVKEESCINCVQDNIVLYSSLLDNAKLENNILNMNRYSYELRNVKSLHIMLSDFS